MVARLEACGRIVGDEQRADRQPVRETLGERDGVGLHAELLPGEERAAAADARLNLVEHEEGAVLVGQLARPGEDLRGQRVDAAFALHRLEDDRRGLVGDGVGERRVGVVKRTPGSSGSKGVRFAGWPVIESAPTVRPWNEPSSATKPGRPVDLRAHLSAASTASPPELQKNALAPPNRSESFEASSCIGSVQNRFETCQSRSSCACAAASGAGWRWPSQTTAIPPRQSR